MVSLWPWPLRKRTSKSQKNPRREYYACPIKNGERCNNGFVKWCDDRDVESVFLQPPPFKYPECQCGAGVCKREKATSQNKYYFGQGSCGYKVWEDELLHNNKSPVQQSLSCKITLNGFGEGDQNDQDLDEDGKLLVNHSKKMRIMDSSEDPTSMVVPDAELSQSEDEVLEVFICLILPYLNSTHCLPFITGGFPSFNPIDVPKQSSITNVPCGEHSQLDVIGLSQQTQLSSSERKLMSRTQRQRQMAFAVEQQLLIDLATLEPHEHESMKEAAQDTFAISDNLGANDTIF
ncbi:hypothetical protein glysoja_015087 [Glycine soja]|nr:hypothetical protein glysoja_015087 [Glycine soja]